MVLPWRENPSAKIDVLGSKIEYVCFGPPPTEAATIVMLHEGLGCIELWRDFPRQLAKDTGWGVLVYSRLGYGNSDDANLPRLINYMTLEATEVLPIVLNSIGIQRGILLGHSDGATISAIYAGSVNDFRIRGLVLIAPHFFTEPEGLQSIEKVRTEFETGNLKSKLEKYHRNPENAFYGWNDAWLNPEFKNWDVSEVIDFLRIPVLAIQGQDDEFGTTKQIAEIEGRIYSPIETKILANCGHSPQFDQPEQTKDTIKDFVMRLERIDNEDVKIS